MTKIIDMSTPDKFESGLQQVGEFIGEQKAKLENCGAEYRRMKWIQGLADATALCRQMQHEYPNAGAVALSLEDLMLELVPDSATTAEEAL